VLARPIGIERTRSIFFATDNLETQDGILIAVARRDCKDRPARRVDQHASAERWFGQQRINNLYVAHLD